MYASQIYFHNRFAPAEPLCYFVFYEISDFVQMGNIYIVYGNIVFMFIFKEKLFENAGGGKGQSL